MTNEETKSLLKKLLKQRRKMEICLSRYKRCIDEEALLRIGKTTNSEIDASSRLEKARTAYENALAAYAAIEDRIAAALSELTDEEQLIVIDAYINGNPTWKIANKLFLSTATVDRRKKSAITKLSQII